MKPDIAGRFWSRIALPTFAFAFAFGLFATPLALCAEDAASTNANTLTEEEKAAGFALLFDGKGLEGWEQEGNWAVEEGVIARKDNGGALTYAKAPVPDDFELRFEWKVADGSNSGVYYRPGQYEYQLLDNSKHLDGVSPRSSAAALYFCVAPSKDATRAVGEWNTGRIVCKGTVIQHWLNGEKVIDFDYADPANADAVDRLKRRGGDLAARGGNLWLQDHGDPVWFRGIKLRAIPEGETLERSKVEPMAMSAEALEKEEAILERIEKNRAAKEKAARGGN